MSGGKIGELGLKQSLTKFDVWGISTFAAAIVCLLLALQFGGPNNQWSDARTIGTLTLAPFFFIAFALVQYWKKKDALLPQSVIVNRVAALSFSL